jgi:hypothetical protein
MLVLHFVAQMTKGEEIAGHVVYLRGAMAYLMPPTEWT